MSQSSKAARKALRHEARKVTGGYQAARDGLYVCPEIRPRNLNPYTREGAGVSATLARTWQEGNGVFEAGPWQVDRITSRTKVTSKPKIPRPQKALFPLP